MEIPVCKEADKIRRYRMEKKMSDKRRKILVVNDDGIWAEGIRRLAAAAACLGEVVVAAPKNQCSAMSHRISVFQPMEVKQVEFPVEGVTAFQVDGTPADCVKAALGGLLDEKPDFVFSGINEGYNAGVDILYSGTVGAAMEGLLHGIPSIAFSGERDGGYEVTDRWLLPIARELMAKDPGPGRIWNVNFPGGLPEEIKGVRWNVTPSSQPFYRDAYERTGEKDGVFYLNPVYTSNTGAEPGSDIQAVLERFIAVGTVRNTVL